MKETILLNFFIAFLLINCKVVESNTFLIPVGFKGKVIIIFEQKNGTPTKYEKGRRIYDIPNDGILLTQFKLAYGLNDSKFYYKDSMDNRVQLTDFNNAEESKLSNTVGIFASGTTGVYGNSGSSTSVTFLAFNVSNYEYLDSISNKVYIDKFKRKVIEKVGHDF